MPVYNPGEYLRPCLESVLGQTFGDFGLIAIDDSSTDDSHKILTEYAAKDERVTALKNPYNIGAARTRNIGLQLVNGEYVLILDADDYFEPDFFEIMIKRAEETHADITVCGVALRYGQGKETTWQLPEFLLRRLTGTFDWKSVPDYIFELFKVAPFNKLYRRQFLIDSKIQFQDLPNSNDVYFGSASLILAKSIAYINRSLVHYRAAWGGNINSRRGRRPLCILDALRKLRRFLFERGIFSAVRKSFHSYAINNLCFNLASAEYKYRKSAVEFLMECGLKELGMNWITRDDFVSEVYFERWRALAKRGEAILTVGDFPLENSYRRFFEWLRSQKYDASDISVWGCGDIGCQFIRMAHKYDFNVSEVYDRAAAPFGKVPVYPFQKRKTTPKLIIVTSNGFAREIADEIWSENKEILVLDFAAYLIYGAGFSECEMRWEEKRNG